MDCSLELDVVVLVCLFLDHILPAGRHRPTFSCCVILLDFFRSIGFFCIEFVKHKWRYRLPSLIACFLKSKTSRLTFAMLILYFTHDCIRKLYVGVKFVEFLFVALQWFTNCTTLKKRKHLINSSLINTIQLRFCCFSYDFWFLLLVLLKYVSWTYFNADSVSLNSHC